MTGNANERIGGGYVMLARKVLRSPVWSLDHDHVRLWMYLLCSARWDERPHQIGDVVIGRGQTLKAYATIAKENEWLENRAIKSWGKSRVGRMLKKFEGMQMICTNTTPLGTLITINNYNDYQDPKRYGKEPGTELGTDSERSGDDRK